MIRWIAMPLICVALMFSYSQAKASDINFSVGSGNNNGYVYYPNNGYTNYYPYTSDTYGYYTPTYSYNTDASWYGGWYGDSGHNTNYWRGNDWDGGRRGSWDGRGSYSGSRGGFSGRSSNGGGGGGGHGRR